MTESDKQHFIAVAEALNAYIKNLEKQRKGVKEMNVFKFSIKIYRGGKDELLFTDHCLEGQL